ncbi:MAG: T9SS type A sorting domain-containing protein, partial [FCB group bacterium]
YGDTWNEINDGITDWDEGRLTIKDNYIYYGSYSGLIFKAKLDDLITDVKENEQNIKTIITPNPASDFLNIYYENLNGKEISIYDMLGNKLKSVIAEGMNTRINIESLSTGIYLIRIGVFSKLFIKE